MLLRKINNQYLRICKSPQLRPFHSARVMNAPSSVNDLTKEPVRKEFVDMLSDFDQLMDKMIPVIREYYLDCGRPKTVKMNEFALPDQILKEIGEIKESGQSIDQCVDTLKTSLKYSLKTMHPFFMDKLYAGSEPIGQVAELVTAILNTHVHVYHVAPVFSVMEVECVKIFGKEFGFKEEHIDGTLNPGGSMSNMMALLAARQEHFPHVRNEGWKAEDKPVAFTSVQSHYSVARGAMVAGMGINNLVNVPCDRMTGVMIPEKLEEALKAEIEKGNKPFFVNTLAGSTVMGGFDDQNAISAICKKYGVWHHIDACWGGYLVFSNKLKTTLFAGAEKADSISINPHKGLSVPTQCSLLLTNNKKDALRKSNHSGAEYLFHETEYSKYDIGDKTLSCGRRGDGLKLWMCMQRNGLEGFRAKADDAMEKSVYITNQIKKQPEKFTMVNEPQATNICFWYIPKAFRNGAEYTDS
mmetsp:Transcript_18073/g.30841  ORF Transcript_18073/g.30841 Transcript_18073/m.30841 type:complete len:469 (+) Transcript_18073:27-1433(+)